ncbi:MAG: sigma-70 family RNA polymerase sigma factor [Bacteroidales bacterium]|nr:sigma-70 family RNA polymerase sigma factor [Bacteroidales bacterium]
MVQQYIDTRSDQELVEAYQNGEQKVFQTLLERHKQKVFNYILSFVKDTSLADDIFQDTFIKVVNTLRSGSYRDEGKFIQWVMRIAHNLIIDYARKGQKFRMVYDNEDYSVFDTINTSEFNMEDKMIKSQIYQDVRYLIKQLPKEQRKVLVMRHYANMSFKEIAEKTGVSINTALGRMRYALINIRRMAEERSLSLTMN